jgi:hypothetical protein
MNARSFAAVATAAAALAVPSAAFGSTSAESLLLDSYAPGNAQTTGPVTTNQSIPAGTVATVTVRGTFALYARSLMDASHAPYVICGAATTAAPLTASPGLKDSIAGFDAEFIYRRPFVNACSQALPIKSAALQVNAGDGTWAHPAVVGATSGPTADHVYRYSVVGSGAPLSFRLRDAYTGDNDGVLEITVGATTSPSAAGTTTTTPAVTGTAGNGFTLSASKSCASRRSFSIHLKTPKHDGAVSATVRVNGKTTKVIRRRSSKSRLISAVDLRGLPAGTAKVVIVIRTKSGKVLKSQRTYHTCVKRKSAAS